jgi:hypothetical protein
VLNVRGQHEQAAVRPIRRQIHPGHEAIAKEKREHVTAPFPFLLWNEDFDAVVEAKQS